MTRVDTDSRAILVEHVSRYTTTLQKFPPHKHRYFQDCIAARARHANARRRLFFTDFLSQRPQVERKRHDMSLSPTMPQHALIFRPSAEARNLLVALVESYTRV